MQIFWLDMGISSPFHDKLISKEKLATIGISLTTKHVTTLCNRRLINSLCLHLGQSYSLHRFN